MRGANPRPRTQRKNKIMDDKELEMQQEADMERLCEIEEIEKEFTPEEREALGIPEEL